MGVGTREAMKTHDAKHEILLNYSLIAILENLEATLQRQIPKLHKTLCDYEMKHEMRLRMTNSLANKCVQLRRKVKIVDSFDFRPKCDSRPMRALGFFYQNFLKSHALIDDLM